MQEYSEENIQKLDPQQHVRMRPGMYIGGTGVETLHLLLYEVLHESVEFALNSECTYICIVLHPENEAETQDNAPPISTDIIERIGVSRLELFMSHVGVCRPWVERFHVSGGLYGIGIITVNAVSAPMTAEISRDGFLWRQTYREGKAVTPVEQVRPLAPDEGTGNRFIFKPDFTVLEPNEFDYDTIAKRCKEIAYNVPSLTIDLRDERVSPPREEHYHFERGTLDQVRHLNAGQAVIHEAIYAHSNPDVRYLISRSREPMRIPVVAALQFSDSIDTQLIGYINTVQTTGKDRYFAALRQGIQRVINEQAKLRDLAPFRWNEIAPGLCAVVSILHPRPTFMSMKNVTLLNREVYNILYQTVRDTFREFAEQKPDEMASILEKCQRNRAALNK
jgi:DNA gyrase subunit B